MSQEVYHSEGSRVQLPVDIRGYLTVQAMAKHPTRRSKEVQVPFKFRRSVPSEISIDISTLSPGEYVVGVEMVSPGKPKVTQLFSVLHKCDPLPLARKRRLNYDYRFGSLNVRGLTRTRVQ